LLISFKVLLCFSVLLAVAFLEVDLIL